MKNFTPFLRFCFISFFCLSFFMISKASDVVIIGVNTEGNDDIAFVATNTIAGGTILYFNDRSWTGSSFTTTEGALEYTVPAGGLTAGTVVTVSMSAASVGSVTEFGTFNPANGNDPIYAYTGTDANTPTEICSVFSDVALSTAEDPTSEFPNAVVVAPLASDQDNAEYIGPRTFGSVADFIAAITMAGNYMQSDDTGDQSFTLNTTSFSFSAGVSFEALVDCDDNTGTDAAFGEMYVHISNVQNTDGANPLTFTSTSGTVTGQVATGGTSATLLISGLTAADFGTLLTLTADNNGVTSTIEIPVAICGFDVDTGGDGNTEDDVSNGVFCTSQNGEVAPGILTQVIGGNAILSGNDITSSYTYVLVDNTNSDMVVATNSTGIFDAGDGVSNMNTYTVYAFFVSDSETAFTTELGNLTTISAGDDILAGTGAFANVCYNFCCNASFTPNCCTADAGDLATTTATSDFIICEGVDLLDDAMASAVFNNVYTETDEIDPNVNDPADYETVFITADAAGNILEFNATGDFDFSNDAVYIGGNTYSIYALNYKVDNTPTTAAAYLTALTPTTIAQIIADDSDTTSGGAGGGNFCLDLDGLNTAGTQVTVQILPEPVVDNQTTSVCSDVATALTLGASTSGTAAATYNITTIDLGGLTASAGSPATGTGLANDVIEDDAFTNTTGANVDVVYTITPVSASGCLGDPFTVTVTVESEPVVDNQTTSVCSDVATALTLGASTSGTPAATYNITTIDLGGLTASAGSPATGTGLANDVIEDDAFTNTTGANVDVVYTITPVSASGCLGDPFMVTVTVESEPVVDNQTTSVCSDVATALTLGASTSGTAAATYNITTIDLGGLTASAGSPATGTGLANDVIEDDAFTNTTGANVDVIYTITPVSASGCLGDPFTVTVTVESEPVVDNQTTSVCSDVATALTLGASTSGTAAATYNITTIDLGGLTASAGSPATGTGLANDVIEDDAFTNTTGANVDVLYTITPVSASGCLGDPFTVTVTVESEPVVDNQTTSVCSDVATALTLGASTSGTAAATYNITTIDLGGLTASAGSPATGTGLANDVIEDDAFTNTTGANVDVLYTITPVSASGCLGDPFTVTVTVESKPVVDNQTTSVCSDVATALTLGASTSGTAAATYNITTIDLGGLTASAGSPATGTGLANDVIEDDAFTNTTGANVDVIYTITPVSASGCLGDPFTVTVTVESEPVVDNQTTSVCSDVATALTLGASTSGTAAATYNITTIDLGGLTASAGSPATGTGLANDVIEDDAFTNTTGANVDVIYTITPVSASGCLGDPFTVTVTVESEPVVDNQTTSVCSDVATALTLGASTSGTPAATYNITTIDLGGLTASAGSPATGTGLANDVIEDDAFTNTTGANVDVIYTITPVSASGCLGDPFTVTVTVESEPVVDNQTTSVCSDVATALTLGASTSGTAAATYNITTIDLGGLTASAGSPATGTGLANDVIEDDAFTNTTGANVDVVYTITPVSASGCLGDPFTVTVTVESEPVVDNQTTSVCSDVATALTLGASTSGTPAATYNITTIDLGGLTASAGSPATGTGLANDVIEDDAFTNTTGANVDVVYTITPVSASGCLGDPFMVTVTVESEPVVDNQTTTICSASPTGVTLGASTSGTTATTYNITDVNVATGLTGTGTSGSGLTDNAIIGDVFTNPTTSPLDVVYTITPLSTASCAGNPFTVTVTIDPMIDVDLSAVATDLCYKAASDLIDLSGDYISGSTNTGTWTTNGDGTFNDASNMHPAVTAYTTGTSDRSKATVTLTLTAPSGNTCPADSDNITITIRDVTCTNNSFFSGDN